MNRTGRACAESIGLHILMVGCVALATSMAPVPPPTIHLDFSLLEPFTEIAPKGDEQPNREPTPPPPLPSQPEKPQPAPAMKPREKVLTKTTPARVKSKPPVPNQTESVNHAAAEFSGPTNPASEETTNARNTSASLSGNASAAATVETYRRTNFSIIRNAILANLHYPITARRQGLRGKVEIAFLVTPEGGVGELRVIRSSGHTVLDEEALAAIRRSAPFTPPHIATPLVMPVSFELN